MVKLVLMRHGESTANQQNIFTGWSDVELTELGRQQAITAANHLKNEHILFDDVHTSMLKRAIITTNLVCEELEQSYLPLTKTWRLNERHYGSLRGINKDEAKTIFGAEQVAQWRRGYKDMPPKLSVPDHHPQYDKIGVAVPLSESLEMTLTRLLPYWEDSIAPKLVAGHNQLVVAHGSSLRALVKYLENISDSDIVDVEVPNGEPIIYDLDNNLNIIDKKIIK